MTTRPTAEQVALNLHALRKAAEAASQDDAWQSANLAPWERARATNWGEWVANLEFIGAASPGRVLALLDRLAEAREAIRALASLLDNASSPLPSWHQDCDAALELPAVKAVMEGV